MNSIEQTPKKYIKKNENIIFCSVKLMLLSVKTIIMAASVPLFMMAAITVTGDFILGIPLENFTIVNVFNKIF